MQAGCLGFVCLIPKFSSLHFLASGSCSWNGGVVASIIFLFDEELTVGLTEEVCFYVSYIFIPLFSLVWT